jgi:hypothetical protein
MCNNRTDYLCNLQMYLGKVGPNPEHNQGARVVTDLAEPLFGSGRNITVDSFFTSHALGQSLLSKNLTILGTIRKNKGELPHPILVTKRPEHESIFAFTADTTLVSYSPKKNRSVILMSTMHNKAEVDTDGQGCKPYMILDYNATKGAVDAFDQCISYYTCCHQTRRWPMRIFFFLIDAACYNAYVLWKLTSEKPNKRVNRCRIFLTTAGEKLVRPFIEMRAIVPTISHQPSVARAMLSVGVQPVLLKPELNKSRKRGRCHACPRKKDVKVENRCAECEQFVCQQHAEKKLVCKRCPPAVENVSHDNQ